MTNEAPLTGKTALVTGGASGIGAAIVTELADLGADLVIADIDGDAARTVAAQISAATVIEVDLDDAASVQACAKTVLDEHGGADIVVNNAGLSVVEPFLASDAAGWDQMWRINLRAPMQLTQVLLPAMIDRGWGRLIYVATDAARAGAGGESVYAACKAGLFGLAKTLAREMARHGITSNVVCPGLVDTPMLRKHADENPAVVKSLLRRIPIRRAGQAEEVAAYVGFLASPRAGYVTGQTVSISGGVTMM